MADEKPWATAEGFLAISTLVTLPAVVGGVPKGLTPHVVLPMVSCCKNTGRPRLAHGVPTGAMLAASQSACVSMVMCDKITRLVPVEVRLNPEAKVCAFCCGPALVKFTPRTYICPRSRVT